MREFDRILLTALQNNVIDVIKISRYIKLIQWIQLIVAVDMLLYHSFYF